MKKDNKQKEEKDNNKNRSRIGCPSVAFNILSPCLKDISPTKNEIEQSLKCNKDFSCAKELKESIWALLVPVIILGGIYAGIFTPTESAVAAIIYSIIIF